MILRKIQRTDKLKEGQQILIKTPNKEHNNKVVTIKRIEYDSVALNHKGHVFTMSKFWAGTSWVKEIYLIEDKPSQEFYPMDCIPYPQTFDKPIKFELAELAKEKGFDIKTQMFYNRLSRPSINNSYGKENDGIHFVAYSDWFLAAPTGYVLFKWLLEKKFISINAYPTNDFNATKKVKWTYGIVCRYDNAIHDDAFVCCDATEFETWDEAMEAGMKFGLDYLKATDLK